MIDYLILLIQYLPIYYCFLLFLMAATYCRFLIDCLLFAIYDDYVLLLYAISIFVIYCLLLL